MNASVAMNRRTVVARILEQRSDALVVASLGNPTYDVSAVGDDDRNFYVWGAMGGACMVALGLALAQPKRQILAFAGDGEMLMGMGTFATIGVRAPTNLKIIVIDNEHYGETGMQPAHSGRGVDIAGIARACGIEDSATLRTERELDERLPGLQRPGLQCLVLKVAAAPEPSSLPPRDGPYLRSRFREAVLGKGRGAHA
jgi:thiamine pyrophosphate-dependent acetolactate synthase large subunit-like protein